MNKYFEEVEIRRNEASKAIAAKNWKTDDSKIDPLNRWLDAKKSGKINPLGYEPTPSKSDSKLGVNIVIPLNPIGIPKYDNGERFDLRLPYAETGYEDPEADVMGKFFKSVKSIFQSKPRAADTQSNQSNSTNKKPTNPIKK